MFKIEWEISDKKLEWDIGKLFSIADQHHGICLFTSLADRSAGKNIVGINPVYRFGSLCDIDNFISTNPSDEFLPFILGCIAYDHKDKTEEKALFADKHENVFPELCFNLFEHYIVADNSDNSSLKLYRVKYPFAHERIEPESFLNVEPADLSGGKTEYIGSSLTKTQFENGVEQIRDYILNGDIYQANLTRKIEAETSFKPVELAVRLKDSNAIEFGVFAKIDGKYVISTSPERFYKVRHGTITASPIKGTSPRYADKKKDRESLSGLENSEKDRAELAMIVDLLRNDMNRICSNVQVEGFPLVMKLKNVYHLYSNITGKLNNHDFSKIIKALFPAGSITGCP
ncbi:MAG: chorismate-binding protein, partial [Candidatus Delongbacteria bacterium]|nr:chorismate-binding protein [Candidatus Delongbacteria bacterium]